ncbi:hypothetical protein E2C01_086131 [Portunus trituberculatus]|uniref:Uncharacterized protein n=1 Tax=Portunus trituberculatus TaxID=210409 RepID=A0A5B7J8V3_PORTR|nr:hypothetical protein [Portunus trituberculatus]
MAGCAEVEAMGDAGDEGAADGNKGLGCHGISRGYLPLIRSMLYRTPLLEPLQPPF